MKKYINSLESKHEKFYILKKPIEISKVNINNIVLSVVFQTKKDSKVLFEI